MAKSRALCYNFKSYNGLKETAWQILFELFYQTVENFFPCTTIKATEHLPKQRPRLSRQQNKSSEENISFHMVKVYEAMKRLRIMQNDASLKFIKSTGSCQDRITTGLNQHSHLLGDLTR